MTSIIERPFLEFYESLLSHKAPKEKGFTEIFLPLLPKISELSEWLEQPIGVSEVEKVIDDLQSGKSPVPEGLGAAFYEKCKKDLTCILLQVYRECYENEVFITL